MARLEGFLRSMDTNGNGTLEPTEVPPERRGMYEMIAGRMGLDPKKPVPIGEIREAAARRMSGSEGERDENSRSGKSEKESASKSAEDLPPLVPGFGVAEDLPRVPGFGERLPLASAAGSPSGSSRRESASGGSSRSDPDRQRHEERLHGWAQGMLRRADRDGSGAIEKHEWGEVRDPERADRNNDGVITLEELTARLVEYSRGRSRGEDSDSSSGSSDGDDRKSYRFLTPAERLPDEIPDWFVDKDTNEDGQVAMAEYTFSWTDSDARRFARYDLNGDGIITPQECLQADDGEVPEPADGTAGGTGDSPGSGGGSPDSGGDSKPWWMSN